MATNSSTHILAIGGGKGGVGKSFVTAGLATAIAGAGKETVLIDLDLGAANLHTIFGLKTTDRGIGDFLYAPHSNELMDYAVETGVPRLKLVSGNGFIPGIANLAHQQKVKILRAIQRVRAEVVLLDLGAGTSYNVVDFFSITESGIVVTVSEPTAILNAYEFLKNVLFRIFNQRFKKMPSVISAIDAFKINPGEAPTIEALIRNVSTLDEEAGKLMRDLCRRFRPGLVINMNRGEAMNLGQNLQNICRTFLNLEVDFLGAVPADRCVQDSLIHMKPVTLAFPDSLPSKALREISRKCTSGRWIEKAAMDLTDADAPETASKETRSAPKIDPLLAGHKDAELSVLLSKFLTEYSTSSSFGVASTKPVSEKDAHLSPWDFQNFEPRLQESDKVPVFATLETFGPVPQRKRSLWNRWVANHKQVFMIRSIPSAENVVLAIEHASVGKVSHSPEVGWAWMATAMDLMDRHQFSEACRAFGKALACLPNDPLAINNCAAALLTEGSAKIAFDLLCRGIEQLPKNPFLLFNAGLAHFLLRQYQEASVIFSKIVDAHWKNPSSVVLMAHSLYQTGRYENARMAYDVALSADMRNLQARFNIGLCQLREHKYLEAASMFTNLLMMAPEDAEALAARGLAYWCLNRKVDAAQDLSAAIQKQPSNLSFRGLRGVMAFLSGHFDKAIEDIEIITRLLPENENYRKLLVEIRGYLIGA
jgi:flagellar biosynthesis protein FlhG